MLLDWVSHLDAGTEEQFAALTIDTGDGARFVSYRGTDSTLVGWKEDFNMSYQTPVPAQRSAAEYLSDALRRWGGPLRLGGHSKGGNLAVYAAGGLPDARPPAGGLQQRRPRLLRRGRG